MAGPFINDLGHEVPNNKIVIIPSTAEHDGFYKDILMPLKGESKRDWFTSHFYYCLPLTIGNQYGFVIKSTRSFEATWAGGEAAARITFLDEPNEVIKQHVSNHFYNGILTFQNFFSLKTPPGINLMTIQPPNFFIPGCAAMTGVVEADQIRRDFTFNLKITVPNYTVRINKGDIIGAFIPIPRDFVNLFEPTFVTDLFTKEMHLNEIEEANSLSKERNTTDKEKPHFAGRRYFNGVHSDGSKYPDHQKRL